MLYLLHTAVWTFGTPDQTAPALYNTVLDRSCIFESSQLLTVLGSIGILCHLAHCRGIKYAKLQSVVLHCLRLYRGANL